jgi:hypothetical protein
MARAPTSGTRKGNGAGWGGPAKGETTAQKKPFEPGNEASTVENRTGAWAYRQMQKADRVEKLREMLFTLAESAETEAVKKSAIEHLWDREEGKAVARAELTGKDGGPLMHEEVSAVDRLKSRIDGLAARSGAVGSSSDADGI